MPSPLLLRLRKALPDPVRRLVRLSRHMTADPQVSPPVPQNLLDDCRFVMNRYILVEHLPKHGRVAEIGTDTGAFAKWILHHADPRELHVVDLDFTRFDNSLDADPRLHRHSGRSDEVLAGFQENAFDWIYIDANHTYSGVAADIACARSKVRPGGYLVFNDYAHIDAGLGRYGVHRAVSEFAVSAGWPFAFFAYEGNALYDVALRRPDRH